MSTHSGREVASVDPPPNICGKSCYPSRFCRDSPDFEDIVPRPDGLSILSRFLTICDRLNQFIYGYPTQSRATAPSTARLCDAASIMGFDSEGGFSTDELFEDYSVV
ncbi:hypothetical protein EVAR_39008_1 [Eumeta japonica]|uniref:Uncharacterized protein n=1 Tax=Eumeta variegata TaxID=151549 RepID=A0A4C1WRT7_EUMVA|nr:hypothetical protein EVAR_39008_1 [Eumeta japonica]